MLNEEAQKLEKWAEDRIFAAELEIKDAKKRIAELKRPLQKSPVATETLNIQKELQEASRSQTNARRRIFEVEDEVFKMRDALIDKLKAQNKQHVLTREVLQINWEVV